MLCKNWVIPFTQNWLQVAFKTSRRLNCKSHTISEDKYDTLNCYILYCLSSWWGWLAFTYGASTLVKFIHYLNISKLVWPKIWWRDSIASVTYNRYNLSLRGIGAASLEKFLKVRGFMETFVLSAYISKHIQILVGGNGILIHLRSASLGFGTPTMCMWDEGGTVVSKTNEDVLSHTVLPSRESR